MTYRERLDKIKEKSEAKQEEFKEILLETQKFKNSKEIPKELSRYRDSLYHQYTMNVKRYNDLLDLIKKNNIELDSECEFDLQNS